VIVLDTSSWMAARSGNRTLMDVARERARQYLKALPRHDRVMLVRADALATPATSFEPDRRKVELAIQASQPGSTALNLDQALAFARHVQGQDGRRVGEIAFIGPGRTAPEGGDARRSTCAHRNSDNVENVGLRRIGTCARRGIQDLGNLRLRAQPWHAPARRRRVAGFRSAGAAVMAAHPRR
jgi:hypothetical protein